jgi:hypothetical protein
MMERRDMVGGGLAGLTALFGSGLSMQGTPRTRDDEQVARAIDDLRELIGRRLAPPFVELAEIRQQQHIFLKASQKFPDFIEVGIDVWERVYDWHVRNRLPANLVRRDDGRYTMAYMFTTIVLRPEQADNYIGFAYDAR